MRLRKALIWSVAILAVVGVTGFFILPPIAKSLLVEKVSQALQRPVSIDRIRINPYLLTMTVRGLEIKEKSGPEKFVSFDELYINLDTASIYRRALVLKEIRLTRPYFRIIRNPDATYNFSDLLTRPAEKKEDQEKKSEPFRFSLNNIRIEQGSLDFWDGPRKTKHTVRDLLVAVPFISNMSYRIDHYTQPLISANINGNLYALRGKTKPFADSLETVFDIEIKDLNIPYYLAYLPAELNFRLPSGFIDARLQVSYMQSRKKNPSLSVKGDVALKQLVINDRKDQPLLRFPSISIVIASLEPLAPAARFQKISLASPEANIRRGRHGELNLMALSTAKKDAKKPPGKQAAARDAKEAPPPLIDVDQFVVQEGKVAFRDEQPRRPVALSLTGIGLKVNGFSTRKESRAQLEMSAVLDNKGLITAAGPFDLDPLSAELTLKLDNIGIRAFQPYFTDRVKIGITSGHINAAGNLSLNSPARRGLSAKYAGNLLIANFRSIDRQNAEDFLKWKSLFLNNMQVGYNPLSVNIGQIALADFYTRLVVNSDGTLNVQNIVEDQTPPEAKKGEQPAGKGSAPEQTTAGQKTEEQKKDAPPAKTAAAVKKEPARTVRIGAITLQGGAVEFLDRKIKPHYSAKLSKIGGRISGLTSTEEKPAEVELRGKFQDHMPLEITGKINPLRENLFVDLKASFKDMDLSPVSPYSGKYIGYAIQKGKLSFDLRYLIVNRKLDSENRVFVDQLTLGNQVPSPDATKLPVGLAIALLRDRNGEIHLDIPVTGSTDDPQFSLGRLIIQVLVNLLTKAATAPFALLGSLFGGGEELSYVEFDYGRATVPASGQKKLQTLVKALYERPALKLDIEGHADPERDREGFKNYVIERKMKARKLNDMIKQGSPELSIDEVKIEPREHEKYLTQVYRAESFPKPRNIIGLVKSLPVPEMEKLLMTYTVVRGDDLKLLAAQRAQAVKETILKSPQIAPERVFIVEPKTLAPEKKEKVRDSRVDFRLK